MDQTEIKERMVFVEIVTGYSVTDQANNEQQELEKVKESLVEEKRKSERTIHALKQQIDTLMKDLKDAEKQISTSQKKSTITEIKIAPKFYLLGMFEYFDFVHAALCIIIEGKEHFYPLEAYHGAYLPVSGSRVAIFRSENKDILIYGFDGGVMITPPSRYKAVIKSYSIAHQRIKVWVEEFGYLTLNVKEAFFQHMFLSLGMAVILKRVDIDARYYFMIDETLTASCGSREDILKRLVKER